MLYKTARRSFTNRKPSPQDSYVKTGFVISCLICISICSQITVITDQVQNGRDVVLKCRVLKRDSSICALITLFISFRTECSAQFSPLIITQRSMYRSECLVNLILCRVCLSVPQWSAQCRCANRPALYILLTKRVPREDGHRTYTIIIEQCR